MQPIGICGAVDCSVQRGSECDRVRDVRSPVWIKRISTGSDSLMQTSTKTYRPVARGIMIPVLMTSTWIISGKTARRL